MFGGLTQTVKMYIMIGVLSVVAGFLVLFKLRGNKIDALQNQVDNMLREVKARKKQADEAEKAKVKTAEMQDTVDAGEAKKTEADAEIERMVKMSEAKKAEDEAVKKGEPRITAEMADRIRVGL